MAQETLQKQWFQTPANFSQIDGPPSVSTCHTSQSIHIAVGDFVHVHPTDKQLGLYIARVEGLYEDVGGKRYLNVRWYYRPEDLQHQPPCHPIAQEVYHTDHLGCQLIDSIAGYCQVIFKTDSLKVIADERNLTELYWSFANLESGTYICEFAYSARKGVFSPLNQNDECPCDLFSCVKYVAGPSTRGTAAVAKELAEVLLDVEVNIPKEILPVSWVNFRQAWLHETANAKTIKEVAQALLDLEDGVRILNDRRTLFPKDHAAWRKTVSGIHTYDLLAKYVKLFKLDVQHIIMNSVSNQTTRRIHHDHGFEKRKHVPDTKSNKLQKTDGIHSSLRQGSNSSQQDTRPVALEALPLSSKCPDKEIVRESIYEINQEFLPPDAPTSLKFMRAVLVAEKTRFNVTVKYPSMASLQSYFDRAPEVMTNDRIRGTAKLPLVLDQVKKETCIGTKPELDDHYTMTPKLAERVLIRRVSCTECLHQGHLWSFWVVEEMEEVHERGGKETVTDHDLEDEAKGELGAAEALTQLIPGNAMIVTPKENRAVNERSSKFCSEEPLRSQIKWGIRSLRRASFGNRSGTGSSPNSCDTGTKDANRDTRKTFSRKTLEFSDEQHQNIGQTTKGPNFLLTERSGRMQSRREEKFIDLVPVKCPGTLGKSGNSKHIRSNTILKLPKDMKGRWASERYKSAQLKLIEIMHKRGAVPGKPILRPALREEARKDIGDTGLLDHLLKHMTDTVVNNGERFRRRHNAEGAMEYWLEDASLMEIRKAAGIEDPSWIPPSGWKPGDALPGRGECAYGCFSRGMTSAEADEMKKLKVMVDKATRYRKAIFGDKEVSCNTDVRSDLQSLTSRVRRWRSREATPERTEGSEDDEHEIGTENGPALMQRNSESQKERRREVEEGKSACRILKEDKSQLLTDLSEVQRSVALMQEFIKCTMKELGFPQEQNVTFSSNQINSTGAIIESRPVNAPPPGAHDATWGPVGPPEIVLEARNCLAKTSSSADTNRRMCRELESDRSKHEEVVDFASTVGSEPKRPHLLQSSSGHISGMQNGFKTCPPFASGGTVQPGMVIPHTGAHDVWAEDVLAPRTLSAAANTSAYLGRNAETSREDASARVIRSITGSGNESHFRPYFQHRINFFLPSTDTEVERHNQNKAYLVRRPDGNRVKWTAGSEGRDYQATSFHQAAFQSESLALVGAGLESAQARDGLTILSFAADVEAVSITSQEQAKAQAVSQNDVSAIANSKYGSSLAAGPTRGHLPAVTEARKRRMLHQVDTDQLPIMSSVACSGCDTGGDSTSTSLSAAAAAPCDRRGSFKASASVANGPFDETLPKPTSESTSRPQHLMLTAVAKETPTAKMAKDLSINLSLTSHVPPGPSNSGHPCNFPKSFGGSIAEPSSTLTLSRLPAAKAVGIYGHVYPLHNSVSADQLESLQQVAGHSLEQTQALTKKNLLKGVRSTMQKSFPEIVSDNCSTQSSTSKARSSTWLGLAPPTSSNSLS